MRVERISLSLSNAFLIRDRKNLLVDCGCHSDQEHLRERLVRLGVATRSLSAVVLTHVHFDHCGCAAFLRSEGVPVIAAQSAVRALFEGRQEGQSKLVPVFKIPWLGERLSTRMGMNFPRVEVDVAVVDSLDLSDFGVEGQVIATPGHTEGSLSVMLADRSVCVGDLVMGGNLGLPPAWQPRFHPLNLRNDLALRHMLDFRRNGFTHFRVGHGDTLEARDVDAWIEKQHSS